MFIGISGNICSGKSEVARYLRLQGFIQLRLKDFSNEPESLDHTIAQPPTSWYPESTTSFPAPIIGITAPHTLSSPHPPQFSVKASAINEDEDEDEDIEDDDEEDEDDDDEDKDAEGDGYETSASVEKLIHELTDLTTSEAEKQSSNGAKKLRRPSNAVYPVTPKIGPVLLTPVSNPPLPSSRGFHYATTAGETPHTPQQNLVNPVPSMPISALKAGSMVPWDTNDTESITFNTVGEMLRYVTKHWQTNFVTKDIWSLNILEVLSKRPFFLHIAVDAPLSLRWSRYAKRYATRMASPGGSQTSTQSTLIPPQLDAFVTMCDGYMYSDEEGVAAVVSKARLTIMNYSQSLELLYVKLGQVNLLDPLRLRPSWDTYFSRLANLAAMRSNCMKRQVGCVLVRDKRVIATGYNGTPRGLPNCNEGGCKRCNDSGAPGEGLSTCVCLHAEENALLESGRDRIGESSTLYCNTCPCLTCSIKIVQSGINEVVYLQSYSMDEASAKILRDGKVILRQYVPPSEGLVM